MPLDPAESVVFSQRSNHTVGPRAVRVGDKTELFVVWRPDSSARQLSERLEGLG